MTGRRLTSLPVCVGGSVLMVILPISKLSISTSGWLPTREYLKIPVIATLFHRINDFLSDNILDSEEAAQLLETLKQFIGGDIEFGEILKSTSLPLNVPALDIVINGRRFCFTGTFAYGSHSKCEISLLGMEGRHKNHQKT